MAEYVKVDYVVTLNDKEVTGKFDTTVDERGLTFAECITEFGYMPPYLAEYYGKNDVLCDCTTLDGLRFEWIGDKNLTDDVWLTVEIEGFPLRINVVLSPEEARTVKMFR